jgi:hypothetical protein
MVTWFVNGQPQASGNFFTLETTTLAVGSHTVEVVVEDTTEMVLNDPDQLLIERRLWNVTVALSDKTPPVITISARPATLWPPNGKMVPVTIAGRIMDSGSRVNATTATYAVTDEYGSVQPSGRVTLGSNGSYAFTIPLQASRNGDDKDGRQYTITVRAQDNAGNQGSASTVVTVPHDQGN